MSSCFPPHAVVVALAFALTALPSAGCVVGASELPAPLPEIRSAAPAPGMVWAPGYWHWDGTEHVWIPGRWESPPPAPTP